jgi:hypothetical protein
VGIELEAIKKRPKHSLYTFPISLNPHEITIKEQNKFSDVIIAAILATFYKIF